MHTGADAFEGLGVDAWGQGQPQLSIMGAEPRLVMQRRL